MLAVGAWSDTSAADHYTAGVKCIDQQELGLSHRSYGYSKTRVGTTVDDFRIDVKEQGQGQDGQTSITANYTFKTDADSALGKELVSKQGDPLVYCGVYRKRVYWIVEYSMLIMCQRHLC